MKLVAVVSNLFAFEQKKKTFIENSSSIFYGDNKKQLGKVKFGGFHERGHVQFLIYFEE